MARHAQPREIAEIKGATKHNPQRYKGEVPKAAFALGEPPSDMAERASAVWFELATYAAAGVLTCADRLVLELTCNLIAEYRACPPDFPAAKIGHLIGCLARLGMTPADRQKLASVGPAAANPFDDF
jgi:phage terminase small subunit